MAVNTYLLDVSVGEAAVSSTSARHGLMDNLEKVLVQHFPGLCRQSIVEFDEGIFMTLAGPRGLLISARGYKEGIVTVNVEHYRRADEEPLLSLEKLRKVQSILEKITNGKKSHALPAIYRGSELADRYILSADERILEYDIDKVVFEEQSAYQKVQIVHSKSLGNLLVLDDLQNMSESDLIYTEQLMQRGIEDYKGKDIIILGGGDGCLLWELLKENPHHVTMLELDEVVMNACKEHLRSSCGNCLDNYDGENYKIIVGDCFITLQKFIDEGRKVDYVFGDLTDIPVDSSGEQETWELLTRVLNMSIKVLKPGGKFLTHGNGSSVPKALQAYELLLKSLKPPVEFTKTHAFVPSFLEDWVFYQVTPQI